MKNFILNIGRVLRPEFIPNGIAELDKTVRRAAVNMPNGLGILVCERTAT
jgi:hypothetical protein